jgi:hypothetical protein
VKESHAKRLADLTTYGDSQVYLFALLILGTAVGGLICWPFGHPGEGAGGGAALGLIAWLLMVLRSHQRLGPYRGTHREADDDLDSGSN